MNYFARKARPNIQDGLARGKALPQLSTTSYGDYPRTLLIVLNTECEYCRESLPFYRRLVDGGRKTDKPVHIVGVFPNSNSEVKKYLIQNQLDLEIVANVTLSKVKVAGTPSLILLNRKGEVSDFWIGQVSPAQELQVIDSIFGPGGQRSNAGEKRGGDE